LNHRSLALVVLATATFAGCRSDPTGRVMHPDEPVGVDVHQASVDVFDGMMRQGVTAILDKAGAKQSGDQQRHRMIFAGIQNNSDERLGEKKDYIYDTVDTMITANGSYDMVSRVFVENVLSQMGRQPRAELLLDPQVRDEVVERFRQKEGRDYIGYILWGKFNNATSETGRDELEKKYVLVLELVDVRTGLQVKHQEYGRKAYTK
jgi:hypothetical protein